MDELTSYNNLQVAVSRKQILKIALPITLALLVPQLNLITNNVFISGLGETELATAGITGVYYLVFALIGNGLNSGVQALIARRAGENKPHEIGKIFMQSLWVSCFYAIASIILIYALSDFFLSSVLTQHRVRDEAIDFMKIRIWGVPFLYFFLMGNALLVGTNNSRYLKYGFIALAGSNILLDYLLIYGHWGLPALGFNGAAVGSVIAEFLGMLVIFLLVFYKKMNHRFSIFASFAFEKSIARLIFVQTLPLIAQFLLSVGSWFLFYILIEHTGERPLAISNTMRNIYGIFGIFSWAFASTANAMVSNIIGQGLKDKVMPLVIKITWLSVCFTIILCVLINLFPHLFLYIYGRDESFIRDAIPVIRIVSLGIFSMSFATVWLNAVTGTGYTKVNLGIELIAIIAYSIYIINAIKNWQVSLAWAWAAEIIYWSILFLLSFLFIKSGRWRKIII